MARFVRALNDSGFTAGVTSYQDHFPGDGAREQTAHIVVMVLVAGALVPCIVDTGAPWCILHPTLVRPLIGNNGDYRTHLLIRGTRYAGSLHPLSMTLHDETYQQHLTVDATVFVPSLDADDNWSHPNFIGLDGFLNRIRFAVDPDDNSFYFGAI